MKAPTPDGLTFAEALALFDPPMPRRTLERRAHLAEQAGRIRHLGVRHPTERGGRPARTYLPADLFTIHAQWTTSTQGKKPSPKGG